jgi:hypothetical protein
MATDQRTTGEERTDALPPGVVEELLKSPRRRAVLRVLVDRDGPVPVNDLARALTDDGASRAERRATRTEIYQEHLPKLTATGVVSFDSMLGTVEFLGDDALTARLSALEDDSKDK